MERYNTMKIDQKLLKPMGIAIGGLILLILIIALITSCGKNKKYTFEELGTKLISLTQNYYDKNKNLLPKEDESTSISAQHFVTDNKIKSLKLKNTRPAR